MARDNLFSTLSPADLTGFAQSVQQSNPYGIAGQALGSWSPDMSTWGAGAQGATAFGKAFLSGILGNVARQNTASQLSSVMQALPSLTTNPMGTAVPEGVDSTAFNMLRGTSALNLAQSQAASATEKSKDVRDLLKTVLGEGVKNRSISATDAIDIAASDNPELALEQITSRPSMKPSFTEGTEISNNMPSLTLAGRKTTEQRKKELTQSYIESGMPPIQAAASARQDVEGEMRANAKSFDEAKEAREYGQKLLGLASTAEAGMSQAGQTGSKLASMYEKGLSVLAPWDTPEADKQAAGDAVLASIAPEIIKMSRSPGAVSDFESKLYLGAGPNPNQTPEANAQLVQKMKDLGKLNVDYADFLEAFRDQNNGSTVGAAKKWDEYKQAYPLFVKAGNEVVLNRNRPAWQEFFSGVAAPSSIATSSGAGMDARTFAQQALASGMTKEQARAAWAAKQAGQ